MTERQQVILSDDLRFEFATKCFKADLIKKKSNIKPMLDKLMKIYLTGAFDSVMISDDFLKSSQGSKQRIPIDKILKSDFEDRAWKRGLIRFPYYGVRALELMMQLFLDGKLDKKIEEYDSLEKKH